MSPSFPKPKRFVCEQYIHHVQTQPCLIRERLSSCLGTVCAHHMVTKGAGGSDLTCVPLCVKHHQEWHQIGNFKFEYDYGISMAKESLDLLIEFWESYYHNTVAFMDQVENEKKAILANAKEKA